MVRKLAIPEPVVIFALIIAYIWELRYVDCKLWMPILAMMLASHALRRETPTRLGFSLQHLGDSVRDLLPALTLLALALVAGGLLTHSIRDIRFDRAVLSLSAYLPWGLVQQYVVNGYFLNRFDALVSRRAASMVAAAAFSCAHAPNWFLMAVTLLFGYCATRVYRRYQNLYFLGIAHATVGFLLYLVIPDSISHHLNVGPGWFRG